MDAVSQGPTLIEQTYDSILNAICDGQLRPGERLNQDDLAARMRVSRQPVGQALTVLKRQGFVRDAGRRGLIVAPLERDFFRAIYELREALDPMAARLAAERASPDALSEGHRILACGRAAADSEQIEALVTADMQFHLWLYGVAGNPLILDTMRLCWRHLRRAVREVLRPSDGGEIVWAEHGAMLDAVSAHDAEAAFERALRHARDASLRVTGSLPA